MMISKTTIVECMRERLREIEQPTVCGKYIYCSIISDLIHIKINKTLIGIVGYANDKFQGAFYDQVYGNTINCTTETMAEMAQRVIAFLSPLIAPVSEWIDADFDI